MKSQEVKAAQAVTVKLPEIQHTKPDVFIFESLTEEDRQSGRLEGQILHDILRMSGKKPKYFYFESLTELPHLINLFRQSRYRYLHLSCHGSNDAVSIGGIDVPYDEFAKAFDGHLKLRRLFVSACKLGNKDFVDAVKAKNKGMHSIVAPVEDIYFNHAAAAWSSFYVSIFSEDDGKMKFKGISKKLELISNLFNIKLFMARYDAKKDTWDYHNFGPGNEMT